MRRLPSLAVVAAVAGAAAVACGNGGPPRPPEPLQNLPGPSVTAAAPPAPCADPIAGVWKARVWREDDAAWDEVMLSIHRVGTALRGDIVVTSWDGDAAQLEPPPCPDGLPAISRVVQRARGSFDAGALDFVGADPRRVLLECGAPATGTYHPDHFTGTLTADGEHLDAVNDDGSIDQGRPHAFARTGCTP